MSDKRVTVEEIQSKMDSLTYKFGVVEGTTLTTCHSMLPNGFILAYGESACVDPANYNKELGEKYAKERCVTASSDALWLLEGYALAMGYK